MESNSKTTWCGVFLVGACLLFAQNCVADDVNTITKDPLEKSLNAYYEGDYKAALNITIPLAADGNSSALNLLGMMYELGKGVSQNAEKSVVLYRQAADMGDLYAQYNLGVSYDTGSGTPQNYRQAVIWYQRAAEQGASFAQFNLAIMYEQGRGAHRSYQKAAHWYNKAAKQGYTKAQNNLGYLYESGQGVKKSLVTAYVLFDIAAEQGFEPAADKRDLLKRRMSKGQIKQALLEIKEYKTGLNK